MYNIEYQFSGILVLFVVLDKKFDLLEANCQNLKISKEKNLDHANNIPWN